MKQIADYKVVFGYSINEINKNVNSCISDGWTPLGGVSVKDYIDPNNLSQILYVQAMIYYAFK